MSNLFLSIWRIFLRLQLFDAVSVTIPGSTESDGSYKVTINSGTINPWKNTTNNTFEYLFNSATSAQQAYAIYKAYKAYIEAI